MTPILSVDDMHTGGEPVRIVTGGWPPVEGETILAKRAFARAHHDHLRRILMFEPRGHDDMYGALLVKPSLAGADLAVLFMHNEGWSTMCGHATIAAAHVLTTELGTGPDAEVPPDLRFATASGWLGARPLADGWIELDFPADPPILGPPPAGLLDALGLDDAADGPVVEVARGRLDIVVRL